jgi:hypothetical protein
MYYPMVPDVPGVPSLLRIPPHVISRTGDSMDQAIGALLSISSFARNSPLSPMSNALSGVQEALSLVGIVNGNFSTYPSSLFDPFVYPMTDVTGNLNSLMATIGTNPTGPINLISGTVDNTASMLSNVSDDFFADAGIDDATLEDGVESVTSTAFRGEPQWGIFESGQSVVEADNVVGFDYRKDWTISDYPVEEGAFQSYDKVELPFDARVKFSCGGSLDTRTAFLKSIEDIAGNLTLYDVVTPTKTYQSCNITHVDYRQTAQNGVGLMVVEVYLQEIRDTATATFSQTAGTDPNSTPTTTKTPAPKSPSAQPVKSGGTKQAQPIPAQDSTAIGTALLNTLN